jgi:hypothetical protein
VVQLVLLERKVYKVLLEQLSTANTRHDYLGNWC